jgi:hypothetical protein
MYNSGLIDNEMRRQHQAFPNKTMLLLRKIVSTGEIRYEND